MKFANLLGKLTQEPLYLLPEKACIIISMVAARAFGTTTGQTARSMEDDDFPGRPSEPPPLYQTPMEGVAVISIEGVIGKRLSQMELLCGGCDLDRVSHALGAAAGDPEVSAILLDIDSPGGMGVGLPEISALIAQIRSRKPVIAFSDFFCASAAYWIAAQCDEIYCTPSAVIGSIGAYLAAEDNSKAWQMAGRERLIFNGDAAYKAMGADGKKWTDAEKALMQERSVKATAAIRAAAQANRTLALSTMQGQTFDGQEALRVKLVDGLVNSRDELLLRVSAATMRAKPLKASPPPAMLSLTAPRANATSTLQAAPQKEPAKARPTSAACYIGASRILGR